MCLDEAGEMLVAEGDSMDAQTQKNLESALHGEAFAPARCADEREHLRALEGAVERLEVPA